MNEVKVEALTPEAFSRFGKVIAVDASSDSQEINSGSCTKFAGLAVPDCSAYSGSPAVHIYRVRPMPLPIIVRAFERHMLGTQAFMPLDRRPYLVVVAPPGRFQRKDVRVFRASGEQGVQYDLGTWHHFCLALEAQSDFLVIDRAANHEDCEEIQLPASDQFRVTL